MRVISRMLAVVSFVVVSASVAVAFFTGGNTCCVPAHQAPGGPAMPPGNFSCNAQRDPLGNILACVPGNGSFCLQGLSPVQVAPAENGKCCQPAQQGGGCTDGLPGTVISQFGVWNCQASQLNGNIIVSCACQWVPQGQATVAVTDCQGAQCAPMHICP